jgi:hypothetical protein
LTYCEFELDLFLSLARMKYPETPWHRDQTQDLTPKAREAQARVAGQVLWQAACAVLVVVDLRPEDQGKDSSNEDTSAYYQASIS